MDFRLEDLLKLLQLLPVFLNLHPAVFGGSPVLPNPPVRLQQMFPGRLGLSLPVLLFRLIPVPAAPVLQKPLGNRIQVRLL